MMTNVSQHVEQQQEEKEKIGLCCDQGDSTRMTSWGTE